MTDVDRNTIASLLLRTGDRCAEIMDGSMRNLRCQYVQADEIWCYVGKKDRHIHKGDSPEMGSQWVFVAMDAETKLVPVYTVGKRNEETTWYFINELAERVSTRIQLTTDGYVFYNRHVEDAFGSEVDFAQIIKLYGQYGQHDTDAKYSPSPIVEVISKVRNGDPDPERICTSHIERQKCVPQPAIDLYCTWASLLLHHAAVPQDVSPQHRASPRPVRSSCRRCLFQTLARYRCE
jgi:IS1 family transposase